jgi:hypothetical protein
MSCPENMEHDRGGKQAAAAAALLTGTRCGEYP